MEVVTFCCRLYVLFLSIVWICGFKQVTPLISKMARGFMKCGKAARATRKTWKIQVTQIINTLSAFTDVKREEGTKAVELSR